MYGISGIKQQGELESLPIFNKQTLELLVGKSGVNLDRKIERLTKKKYLVSLKKGWYVTQSFLEKQSDLSIYTEYIANKLRSPSYLSLEYILFKNDLIPEAVNTWTSVTLKSTREYDTSLGLFSYRSLKKELFIGYSQLMSNGYGVYQASKAKALFDFLYLKKNLSADLEYELRKGLRINWDIFLKKDMREFAQYVHLTDMRKMNSILKFIREIKNAS